MIALLCSQPDQVEVSAVRRFEATGDQCGLVHGVLVLEPSVRY